jgi:hypothetical protein
MKENRHIKKKFQKKIKESNILDNLDSLIDIKKSA